IPGNTRGNRQIVVKSPLAGNLTLTRKNAPNVPKTIAILTAIILTSRECKSDSNNPRSENSLPYQLSVKPDIPYIVFEGLKEKINTTKSGR
ncbi:MAG: hypothetical protein JSV25_16820, partial [Spirochaetota bacterium]